RPSETGPLGDGWRNVGRAGFEYAGRRIACSPTARRQAVFQRQVWRRCADRLEPRLIRIYLAIATDLQEIRTGLFRDAEDGLERHHSVADEAVLVGVAGRQPRAYIFSSRLCERD